MPDERVTVSIYWMSGKEEWRHQVSPEDANKMAESLANGDDWLTWTSIHRVRSGGGSWNANDVIVSTTKHIVRSGEVKGVSTNSQSSQQVARPSRPY